MKFLIDRRGKRIVKQRISLFAAALLLFPMAFAYRSASREVILNVPYISQKGILSTGCELVSATMVLNYYGDAASVEDVVAKTPRSDLIQTENGLQGCHPAQSFIGDPNLPNGFGCYAPVVVSVMNTFLSGNRKRAVDLTGTELEKLAGNYIAKGAPVLVWATMNMKEPGPGKTWTLTGTGETFQWIAGEHCLVFVGYSKDSYYFNDPYDSNGLIAFEKSLVEKRYEALGKQAVAVVG